MSSDNLWGSADEDDDLFLCDVPQDSEQPAPAKTTVSTSQPKKQSWIASSFDDFGDFGQMSQPKKLAPKPISRKRPLDKENTKEPVPSTFSRGKLKPVVDELWADKYAPKTQADLAVHKKKIGEVEGWLQHALGNYKGGPLCLLTGPAGSGKTTTVRVLGREMKLELQEWSNPITTSSVQWSEDFQPTRSDFIPVGGYQSTTQAGQFREFLLRANRYPTLQLGGSTSTSKKVVLIEEIPHVFHKDVSLFHDIIRQHCRTGISPLIFIFSDVSSGDSAERSFFPKQLQAELGITNISFNPIATTSMVKVMQKVSSSEVLQFSRRFETPSKATLEALSAASSGDIRGALNALQFVCLKGSTNEAVWKVPEQVIRMLNQPYKQ